MGNQPTSNEVAGSKRPAYTVLILPKTCAPLTSATATFFSDSVPSDM